jgi:hypothetical protein
MSDGTQTAPASESTGTVEEAASKIEALLSGKKPEKRLAAPAEEAAQPAPEAEQAEEAEPEDLAPETTSSDEDDEAPDAHPETDDEAEGSDEPDPLYTVKINGKEEKVSLKEALNGYQRQQDYTRAKQEFAAEKRQFSTELDAARQEREVYSQLLPALIQRMQSSMPSAPDQSLIDIDPSAYLRQKEAYEQAMGDLQAASSERQRLEQETKVEQQRKLQAFVAENASKLPELIPEWKDRKAYERDRPKVREYLMGRGFSDEEINQAYDARLVAIAADGMRWRELQKSKFKPTAPPAEKALRPTPPSTSAPKVNRDAQAARNRLAKSGRVEDAAAAIRALL